MTERFLMIGMVALVAFFFVGWPLLMAWQRRQIAAGWRSLAADLGLVEDPDPTDREAILSRMNSVSNPSVAQSLRGEEDGVPFSVTLFTFAYRRDTGSGGTPSSATSEATAAVIEAELPEMACTHAPERARGDQALAAGMPSFLKSLVPAGYKPVQVDDPEFSSKVRVNGAKHDLVRAALTDDLRAFLLAHSDKQLVGTGEVAVWWIRDAALEGDALADLVDEARALARILGAMG